MHDRGESVLRQRREECEPAHGGEHGGTGGQYRDAGKSRGLSRLVSLVLEQRVRSDHEREAAVPKHVQPRRGLGPGSEETSLREQAGERQGMRGGHQGGEQVAAGEDQERP